MNLSHSLSIDILYALKSNQKRVKGKFKLISQSETKVAHETKDIIKFLRVCDGYVAESVCGMRSR